MKTQIVDGKLEYIAEPLTKREWFAGMALMRPDVKSCQDAYAWADAMLEVGKE